MYFIDDNKAAIFEVQRFLFVIGQNGELPHLSVDGFYTEETELAVREFQRMHSIKETGVVDRKTYDAIYTEYANVMRSNEARDNDAYNSLYPMKTGDSGNVVSELNSVIRELSRFYRDIPIPYGSFYSKNTESAIKMLQRAFRIAESGETTRELYGLLRSELKSLQKIKNV